MNTKEAAETIRYRDLYRAVCIVCEAGEYAITHLLEQQPSLGDETVRCSSCGDINPRWMTKRAVAEKMLAGPLAGPFNA